MFGFYLQPSVGGRLLSYEFWREFCEIRSGGRDQGGAVQSLPDARRRARASLDSGRADEIALYTGNDDNIIRRPAVRFRCRAGAVSFRGGLLGQWAVWTRRAVELLESIHACRDAERRRARRRSWPNRRRSPTPTRALFDVRNRFAGCIAGLHEILRRQGLLEGRWCLDPAEDLSPGQLEEIDRVCHSYPASDRRRVCARKPGSLVAVGELCNFLLRSLTFAARIGGGGTKRRQGLH